MTASGAAFHPKVVAVAGPERALVAVGSGNLSTGGWHLNKETWTVCTADKQRCPILIKQFAGWLRTLDSLCTITPQAVRGINSTATLLDDLANASTLVETGHELIHTSAARLLASFRMAARSVCCSTPRSMTSELRQSGRSSFALLLPG